MNKRISELAILAGATPDTSGRWVRSGTLEKFAELVVTEFIRKTNEFADETGSNSMDECLGNARLNLFSVDN